MFEKVTSISIQKGEPVEYPAVTVCSLSNDKLSLDNILADRHWINGVFFNKTTFMKFWSHDFQLDNGQGKCFSFGNFKRGHDFPSLQKTAKAQWAETDDSRYVSM